MKLPCSSKILQSAHTCSFSCLIKINIRKCAVSQVRQHRNQHQIKLFTFFQIEAASAAHAGVVCLSSNDNFCLLHCPDLIYLAHRDTYC